MSRKILSEMIHMGQFQSFAEILEIKLRKEIEATLRSEAGPQSLRPEAQSQMAWGTDPDVITQLLGRIGKVRAANDSKAKLYHQYRPAQRPQPKPKPAHRLSDRQELAYRQLLAWDQSLADNFSSKDLKRAFRKMALKLHPDQGGSTQEFLKLQECYQSLNQLFI